MTRKEFEEAFWGDENILCFKWGTLYTDVYVCQKFTEVYILNQYILFYVNYTLRKLIFQKKRISKLRDQKDLKKKYLQEAQMIPDSY